MSKTDILIQQALELFNKALRSAKKPKIGKRYPIYPARKVLTSGWKRRKVWSK